MEFLLNPNRNAIIIAILGFLWGVAHTDDVVSRVVLGVLVP